MTDNLALHTVLICDVDPDRKIVMLAMSVTADQVDEGAAAVWRVVVDPGGDHEFRCSFERPWAGTFDGVELAAVEALLRQPRLSEVVRTGAEFTKAQLAVRDGLKELVLDRAPE